MPFLKLLTTLVVGLLVLVRPACAQSPAEVPAADPVLQGLIDEALVRNRQLEAARQTVVAAETRPAQAGSRPGPTAGIFYQNDGISPSLGREQMTMLGASAGQDIPYPGKLAARRRGMECPAPRTRRASSSARGASPGRRGRRGIGRR